MPVRVHAPDRRLNLAPTKFIRGLIKVAELAQDFLVEDHARSGIHIWLAGVRSQEFEGPPNRYRKQPNIARSRHY